MTIIVEKITDFFICKDYIEVEEKEFYCFALEAILVGAINYLTIALIAVMLNRLFECIMFIVLLKLLRGNMGGIHMKKWYQCYMVSCIKDYVTGMEQSYTYLEDGNIDVITGNEYSIAYVREDNDLVGRSYEFLYNEDNNMSQKRTYSHSTGELTELLLEDTYAYENQWKDQLTEVNEETITYDETGNPLTYRDGMTFEWAGKTLVGVNGQSELDFTYNNEGIRTSKTVDGVKTEYVIEGKDIVFEVTDGNVTAYIYDSDMNVIGMMCGGETYYFEKNVQSDVVRILDEEGNILSEYVYDAWGNVELVKGDVKLAEKNPFRYRSYYYDTETGLYYAENEKCECIGNKHTRSKSNDIKY